jgi:hypothetical protein
VIRAEHVLPRTVLWATDADLGHLAPRVRLHAQGHTHGGAGGPFGRVGHREVLVEPDELGRRVSVFSCWFCGCRCRRCCCCFCTMTPKVVLLPVAAETLSKTNRARLAAVEPHVLLPVPKGGPKGRRALASFLSCLFSFRCMPPPRRSRRSRQSQCRSR